MVDIVSPATRSRMMSGIRGKNTKPELLIRKALHSKGFRYRLHSKELPGKPDIVLPKYRAVIFINGCFWHGHDCHLFKWPSSRAEFWQQKIKGTMERDRLARDVLAKTGWRHMTIWECALKGKTKKGINEVIDSITEWLQSTTNKGSIRGKDEI